MRKQAEMIDIANLAPERVLMALYDRAQIQGMGVLRYTPESLAEADATKLLSQRTYFDYLRGRVMKVRIAGDTLDPRLYDRDNGDGAAAAAIDAIREPATASAA